MRIAYVADELNHHIFSVCDELYRILGDGFAFIATQPVKSDGDAYKKGLAFYQSSSCTNRNMPWYKAVIDKDTELFCLSIINDSDAVIIANTSDKWIEQRLKNKGITFRAHERWYKNGLALYRIPKALIGGWLHHGRYKRLYMLAASAYTAADTSRIGCFRNKTFRWGYYPETKTHDINELNRIKKAHKPVIMWAGRFIDWKHANDALFVCRQLWENGYDFELLMAGDGPEKDSLTDICEKNNMMDYVHFLGLLSPESTRQYMERANIFLFTSDFNEGWGATLNEAMNSGCAVVASHAIGAVPFLVDDNYNGFIYRSQDIEDLYAKVARLLDDPILTETVGKRAYKTIIDEWNAQIAAQRFLKVAEALLNNTEPTDLFDKGICSKAPVIKNDWYPIDRCNTL